MGWVGALMAARTAEQELGMVVLGVAAIAILLYLAWNYIIRKKKVHRVVEGDRQLFVQHKKSGRYHAELLNVFSTTPQVISNIAGLAVATVLLAVQLMTGTMAGTYEYNVCLLAIIFIAVSGISYMFSMEELTIAISPSISDREKFRLYDEAVTMKVIGFFGLWSSVLVLMLLTNNLWVVTIAAAYTVVAVYRHYEIRWIDG